MCDFIPNTIAGHQIEIRAVIATEHIVGVSRIVTYLITSASSAANDRGSLKISGIALNTGTAARSYSLCAAVTSGAGDSDVINWGIEALVIDTGV